MSRCSVARVLVVLMMLVPAGVSASVDTSAVRRDGGVAIGDTLWSDLKGIVGDAGLVFTAPLRFGRNGWLMTGGLIGGTGAAMLVDEDVRDLFGRGHDAIRDSIAKVGNTAGTIVPAGIIIGTLYVGGLAFDEPGIRMAGRHAGEALLFAGTITGVIKYLAGRNRPDQNNGAFTYHGPSMLDQYQSLPSGHTTIAFAVASSLSADIDNPWATAGLYGIATITALSRIYNDRHWTSDVLLAAGISTACGYGVVHLHDVAPRLQGDFLVVPGVNSLAVVWMF